MNNKRETQSKIDNWLVVDPLLTGSKSIGLDERPLVTTLTPHLVAMIFPCSACQHLLAILQISFPTRQVISVQYCCERAWDICRQCITSCEGGIARYVEGWN